jgi:nitrous oxidase accessory protein
VLTITADGVTVRGLHLTHSGSSHDGVDAGILVKADGAIIENNTIDESLFGIHLSNANDNIIRNNRIRSLKERDISIRGDAIRIWYSHGNLIEGNEVWDARDLVFSNASENIIRGNHIHHSRISMEFIYSPDNQVQDNLLEHNVTGITVIYSEAVNLSGNRIAHMRKLTGSGISVKESYDIHIDSNEIAHCAVGLLATSPLQPENILYIENNLFTYNDVATYFYGEKGGHLIRNNRFVNNFVDVMGSAPATTRLNHWQDNYWDRHAGFDLDGNGIGDQPYRVWLYADRIWMERSMARFFRGTVGLSLVDFMERLVPSSDPDLLYEDPTPRMGPLAP